MEIHEFILSTVASETLGVKHQAINIHSANQLRTAFEQCQKEKRIAFTMNNIRN